jgi:tight adherence protein C
MTGPAGAALGVAWAVVVLAGAARCRPLPSRVHLLRAAAPLVPPPPRPGALERLGRAVLGVLRRSPASALAARQAGAGTIALVAGIATWPPLGAPLAAAAWNLPVLRARARERRRLVALEAGLPEIVDLFLVAVGAGLTVPLAVAAVAARAVGPLGPELRRVLDEAALGRRLSDALDDLPDRAGEATRPLVAALTDADRYGSPLAAGLDRLAGELRRAHQRRVEESARRVPVKLLFPLVLCVLPAFALLTVAPLIAGALRALRL